MGGLDIDLLVGQGAKIPDWLVEEALPEMIRGFLGAITEVLTGR